MGKSSSKITRAVIKAIGEGIASGLTLSASAEACGLSRNTVLAWRDRGQEAESGLYRELYLEITAASRRYEQSLLDKMKGFASEGERLVKVKEVTSPDGEKTVTREVSEGQKFNATKWLLERKFGYDFSSDRAAEKTLNRILRIAEKTLPSNELTNFLEAVTKDEYLSNIGSEQLEKVISAIDEQG